MESPGFEPGTLRMRSGCDTTTPQALEDEHIVFALRSEVQANNWWMKQLSHRLRPAPGVAT